MPPIAIQGWIYLYSLRFVLFWLIHLHHLNKAKPEVAETVTPVKAMPAWEGTVRERRFVFLGQRRRHRYDWFKTSHLLWEMILDGSLWLWLLHCTFHDVLSAELCLHHHILLGVCAWLCLDKWTKEIQREKCKNCKTRTGMFCPTLSSKKLLKLV